MKTKLFIVRHAETEGNVQKRLTGRHDYEITENGKETIEKLTEKFKFINVDSIYSSPAKRATETVQGIADFKNLRIIIDKNLAEMFFGIYDGLKWEDVDKINPTIREIQMQINEIKNIPSQESMEHVADRMHKCISNICMDNPDKTLLIASHGVSIEAFLRKITGEKFAVKRAEYSQHNTSINELEYDFNSNSFKIITLNNINHLK
ncbi:MAG: histidine phosphatase family protein [Firmicutes bacterium]|nr:histidine phosphatase family protein [Bacillota bacterium]